MLSTRSSILKGPLWPSVSKASDSESSQEDDFPYLGEQNRLRKYILMLELGDGFQTQAHFNRSDSLQKVVDSLRQSGLVFRADNVLHRGRVLSACKGWQEKTLEESGICNGDHLLLSTTFPREVDIAILSMERVFTVTVRRGENNWNHIKQKLPIPADRTFSVFNQRRLFYRRHNMWQSAISDRSNKQFIYLDEYDGKQVDAREGTHYVDDFLTPDQGLRAAPQGKPYLWVFDDVLWCTEGRITTILSQHALFDSQFVACIYGTRCFAKDGKEKEMYLRCVKGVFECTSGNRYDNINKVFECSDLKDLEVRYFYLLFRENDLIPHWNLPTSETIAVLRRNGIDLKVKNGRIVRVVPRLFDVTSSCWTLPYDDDKFLQDFSQSVREDPKRSRSNENDNR